MQRSSCIIERERAAFPGFCHKEGNTRGQFSIFHKRGGFKLMVQKLSPVVCKNCALLMVRLCYGKHWWFRLVREPLVWGMRILALWNGIDARSHVVSNAECHGCVRFMKAELEEKSPTFRFLNGLIGQKFGEMRNAMLTQEELDEAKQHAKEMMATPVDQPLTQDIRNKTTS